MTFLAARFAGICFLGSCLTVFFFSSYSSAKEWNAGFISSEGGTTYQINVISLGKTLSLSRTFPIDDSNRGIQLTVYPTGTKYLRLEPSGVGLIWNAHALGTRKIAVQFESNYGIWDIETNKFAVYREWYYSWSPLFSRIKALSMELFKQGGQQGGAISADGTRYVGAYKKAPEFSRCDMTILTEGIEQPSVYKFPDDLCPYSMSWSPTGKYLAAITNSSRALRHDLYVWDSFGHLLYSAVAPTEIEQEWPPVWKSNEQTVQVYYRGENGLLHKDFNIAH